jgi:PKD repeat protein
MSTNNPISWEWTFPGGTPATSTEQNLLIQYNTDGLYSVTLKVTNAFGGDNTVTKTDFITVCGVGFSILPSAVSVYPNPTSGKLFITNPAKDTQEIAVFNVVGKQVNTIVSFDGIIPLDMTLQTKGIYMVRITNNATKSFRFKKIILN